MSDLLDSLIARAEGWAAQDPDPFTKAELEALISARDEAELADRFDGTLEFGTAGLRGALGAGSNRMNRVVVTRAAAGLAAYLKDTGAPAGASVVIGYDARHNSDVFARDTAEVMTGAGLRALVHAAPAAHTAAGVRDPRARLRRRRDGDREPQPAAGQRLQGLPRRRQPDRAAGRRRDRRADRGRRRAGRRPSRRPRQGPRRGHRRPLPRHGRRPGRRRAARPAHRLHAAARRRRHLGAAGAGDRRASTRRRWSSSRRSPTPSSRRWRSPTPRSPARWTSRWRWPRPTTSTWSSPTTPTPTGARPPYPSQHGWRMLRGDEVGALLGHHLLAQGKQGTYACSIVSSSLLGKMAAAHGQPYAETLTGFKWISRVARAGVRLRGGARLLRRPRAREGQGRRLGAAAALRARRRSRRPAGRTLIDVLDDIAAEHGLHATDQLSVRVDDLSLIARRDGPAARPPADLAGRPRRRVGRRPLPRVGRPAAHRRPAVPARRGRPGRSSARAAPSRSSSATSRSSSPCTPTTASTPPASPPPAGSTPSRAT